MSTLPLVALLLLFTFNHVKGQEVECKSGKLKGLTVEVFGGKAKKNVNQYLGVPYAEPPVGELRFRPPKEKAPWPDVLDATKQPPLCPQIDPENFKKTMQDQAKEKGVSMSEGDAKAKMDEEMAKLKITGGALAIGVEFKAMAEKLGPDFMKGQEDCLFLNIFVPADATPDSKLPVAIYFHGGMFYAGGIGVPSFDGSILAAVANIIVVVPQFRLGVYGFLHGAAPEMPGNAGLRDQLQSMIWVKDNIAPFGGNPDEVTIMGGNSGGWSVGFHVISAMSKPYFKRGIMSSGSTLAPLMLFGESAARARFHKFVTKAGCPMGPLEEKATYGAPTPETFACLAKLTREDVDKAQAACLTDGKKDAGFLPSEDNTKDICFFCANPFDVVKDGTYDPPGDILIGTNSNEGGMFLSSGLKDIYPPFTGEPKPMGLNDLVEEAKKNGAGSQAGQMQMMLPMFFRGVDKKDPVAVRNRLLELISDGMFVCPDQLLVQSFAKKKAAWYYRFDYRAGKSYWNKWLLGALHMDEHQFIFGNPYREDVKDNYTDKDRKVSMLMMKIWAAFISKGDPVLDKKWKWKPNKGKDKGFLLISTKAPKGMKGFPDNSCKDLTRYYSMGRSFLKNYKPS